MDKQVANTNYEIAKITSFEEDAIKKAESLLKEETGKDYILIAWQKDNIIN